MALRGKPAAARARTGVPTSPASLSSAVAATRWPGPLPLMVVRLPSLLLRAMTALRWLAATAARPRGGAPALLWLLWLLVGGARGERGRARASVC